MSTPRNKTPLNAFSLRKKKALDLFYDNPNIPIAINPSRPGIGKNDPRDYSIYINGVQCFIGYHGYNIPRKKVEALIDRYIDNFKKIGREVPPELKGRIYVELRGDWQNEELKAGFWTYRDTEKTYIPFRVCIYGINTDIYGIEIQFKGEDVANGVIGNFTSNGSIDFAEKTARKLNKEEIIPPVFRGLTKDGCVIMEFIEPITDTTL